MLMTSCLQVWQTRSICTVRGPLLWGCCRVAFTSSSWHVASCSQLTVTNLGHKINANGLHTLADKVGELLQYNWLSVWTSFRIKCFNTPKRNSARLQSWPTLILSYPSRWLKMCQSMELGLFWHMSCPMGCNNPFLSHPGHCTQQNRPMPKWKEALSIVFSVQKFHKYSTSTGTAHIGNRSLALDHYFGHRCIHPCSS